MTIKDIQKVVKVPHQIQINGQIVAVEASYERHISHKKTVKWIYFETFSELNVEGLKLTHSWEVKGGKKLYSYESKELTFIR